MSMVSKVKVEKIHCLIMMLHLPSAKKLKTFVVLDKLKVKKALGLQKLGNQFFTPLIGLLKSNLDLIVLLCNECFLNLQRLTELLDFLLGLN